jgi:ABC-type polar amino acid transport system ATPase subunit
MITLNNLSKHYHGQAVLNDISATVAPNQVIAVIGPSGGGKSTLLRCINFLEEPSSGSILIDGVPLTHANAEKMRQKIGMVFQSFHLFPHLTVHDNITLAPRIVKQMPATQASLLAKELLTKVGLESKSDAKPNQLSGGQKQRVAIARALAMEPSIMLFDEPTSALDPENVGEVVSVIRDVVKGGMTSLIATHMLSLVNEVADRVWFVEHGQIIEDSSKDDFFKSPKTARAQEFMQKVLSA